MNLDKIAISVGGTKEASLYFDHIIPASLSLDLLPEFVSDAEGGFDAVTTFFAGLLPNNFRNTPNFAQQLERTNNAMFHLMWKMLAERVGQQPHLEGVSEAEWRTVEEQAATEFYGFVEDHKLDEIPIVSPGAFITDSETNSGDIALTMSTLQLIDVTKASWAQLAEFRSDPTARQKFRRLRLFAADNYVDKSRSYIEDDLHRRIYDYEEEVRRWGFETRHAALTMLLTSKTLGAALSGSLISALFGAPAISVASAIGGACIEIGRIVLEVSRRRFALRNSLQDNPVSYIEDANDALASDA